MDDILKKETNDTEMPEGPRQEEEKDYMPEEIRKQEEEMPQALEKGFEAGKETLAEKAEIATERDKLLRENLEQEVAKMRLSPGLEQEAEEKAKQIENLDVEAKAKNLLAIAQEKGLAFAVKTAEKIGDPYLLDVFHDILAKDGLYEKFGK